MRTPCECLNPTTYTGPGSSTEYNYCSTCGHTKKDYFLRMEAKKEELNKLLKEKFEIDQKVQKLREELKYWN